MRDTFDLLGHMMQDKITGLNGVVTSIAFDLYGCVQAALHPGLDKDGNIVEQNWFDVARLKRVSGVRVMEPPDFGLGKPADHMQGPAEKPAPRAV